MFRTWPAICLILLVTAGCASFQARQTLPYTVVARAQMRQVDDLTVQVSVLSAAESRDVFGVPLDDRRIQPVWLRIDNHGPHEYLFVPAALDPEYFSPQEVAWAWRGHFSAAGERALEAHLEQMAIPIVVPPGGKVQGYVLTPRDDGVKYVNVDLYRIGARARADFVFDVPGFSADYRRVDFDALFPPADLQYVNLDELRTLLEDLPCCVMGPDGRTPGDPLNIVVIGRGEEMFLPFARRGWDVTETLTGSSVWRTITSSLFGRRYETSPVSPLLYAGRQQDIALQKARGTVDERNHLRLWLTPWRLDGHWVWVGQISRDIGLRFSSKTFVTHKIDPDVDEARDYLLQDLLLSGNLERFGYAGGVGMASPASPRYNYTGDHYFTDGLRVVLFLDPLPVASEDLGMLEWETPVQTP